MNPQRGSGQGPELDSYAGRGPVRIAVVEQASSVRLRARHPLGLLVGAGATSMLGCSASRTAHRTRPSALPSARRAPGAHDRPSGRRRLQRGAPGSHAPLRALRPRRARPLPTPSMGQRPLRYHWVLGPLGAALVAAEAGRDVGDLSWRRSLAHDLAASQRLTHLVGTNGFFTALLRSARTSPTASSTSGGPSGAAPGSGARSSAPTATASGAKRPPASPSSTSTTTAPNASSAWPPSSRATPDLAGRGRPSELGPLHLPQPSARARGPPRAHASRRPCRHRGPVVRFAPEGFVWAASATDVARVRLRRACCAADRSALTHHPRRRRVVGSRHQGGSRSGRTGPCGSATGRSGRVRASPRSSVVATSPLRRQRPPRSRPPCSSSTKRPPPRAPGCPGRCSPPSAPSSPTTAPPTCPASTPAPTLPAPKARCSSSPPLSPQYDNPVPPGGADPPSPYDPTDAVYAAARHALRQRGGQRRQPLGRRLRLQPLRELRHPGPRPRPVLRAEPRRRPSPPARAGGIAVDWALAQVGTPYVWGGETPGVGFDCSRPGPGRLQGRRYHACPGWPRTSTTPPPSSARATPSIPETCSSSAAGPTT